MFAGSGFHTLTTQAVFLSDGFGDLESSGGNWANLKGDGQYEWSKEEYENYCDSHSTE